MASSKKFDIPQGELDSSVCSDRGKLDSVATQAHGFVEGQTCSRGNTSKQLNEAESKSLTTFERQSNEDPKKADADYITTDERHAQLKAIEKMEEEILKKYQLLDLSYDELQTLKDELQKDEWADFLAKHRELMNLKHEMSSKEKKQERQSARN